MWRAEGDGELYTYLPTGFKSNEEFCKLDGSHCDAKYGASVGRSSFKFAPGKWTTVSQRVKLNEEGKSDGELDLFVGGKRVVSLRDLVLRDGNNGKMRGIQMQTFFGGKIIFQFISITLIVCPRFITRMEDPRGPRRILCRSVCRNYF